MGLYVAEGSTECLERPNEFYDNFGGEWVFNKEKAKTRKLHFLNKLTQQIASKAISDYPEFETMTWEDQRRETVGWSLDENYPTPRIDALSKYRGITRNLYLSRTLAKITMFEAFSDKLVGLRQKYADMIDAATSEEELNAIVFDFS